MGDKTCVSCGADCSSQRRVKDHRGRYLCGPCYDRRLAAHRSRQPDASAEADAPHDVPAAGAALGPAVASIPLDDELDLIGLADAEAAQAGVSEQSLCPSCQSTMLPGHVLCTTCGYHTETGAHAGTDVQSGQDADDALRDAKRRERRAAASKQKKDEYFKAGMMFVIGLGIAMTVKLLTLGEGEVLAYGIQLALSVPLGVAVYFLCSLIFLGFNDPWSLITVRIAGIYTVVEAVSATIEAVFPTLLGGLFAWLAGITTYIGLLMRMLELELNDAVIVALLTAIAKWLLIILAFSIVIGMLTN